MRGRMQKNYFKLSYRNLLRNKLTSFVSIFGLSVAIGCSIVFFLLLDFEYMSDRFHENADSIFMLDYTLQGDEGKQRWGDSPLPLGPTLDSNFPQIVRAVRFAENRGIVRSENKVFNESIRFVDPEFLEPHGIGCLASCIGCHYKPGYGRFDHRLTSL